ncbi:hypothetical protein K505DRAFT_372571 [Melanomma pulvis-pyrius CBS 109.77]|uniref:Calcium channel subunit Mid1 n=1 Tax=Melanomma pulvis-pyrius CBS 109.77 TaxID=1314802 RepID=A0A6A6XNW9_9PLEO|nr:hypothetical protein K505DRAFT_372571 [Melanomma pulvis-pyrius CBS 109.77]
MQLPKLTPLQSRLLASLIATCILVVIWIEFQPKYFVYAAELPSVLEDGAHGQFGQAIPPDDANIPIIERIREDQSRGEEAQGSSGYSPILEADRGEEETPQDMGYSPDFAYFDRSLIGRAPQSVVVLTNNVKKEEDSNPGTTRNFVLEKSQLRARRAGDISERGVGGEVDGDHEDEVEGERLEKRQSGTQVWISANTCRQPLPNTPIITEQDSPQLTLWISNSTRNQKPGPSSTNDLAIAPVKFQGGYANFTLHTTSDIFIGVSAPLLTDGWAGSWHFEVAASVDGYYHSYHEDETFLFMVDTDSESALFITPNITANNDTASIDKWKNMDPFPFIMYTQSNNDWGPMTGMERSFCALQVSMTQETNTTVVSSITTKFGEWPINSAKGQFHVQGLKNGTAYQGFLAINGTAQGLEIAGKGIVRNGGQVWRQFNWTTKAEDSCQVVFGLGFCSDVAYAVPSSSQYNFDSLVALYDKQAEEYYQNFTNSLDQVACDTTGTAQYSLARTCDDCRTDYKTWLCSVLMPRCEDFSATDPWLQPRNIAVPFPNGTLAYPQNNTAVFNTTIRNRFAFAQSRNSMIDTVIKPGPYKEMLPCEDLCFDIVRSCPAQLGFSCPNEPARSLTYGKRREDVLTCSFPGAVVDLNVMKGGAAGRVVEVALVAAVTAIVGGFLWI